MRKDNLSSNEITEGSPPKIWRFEFLEDDSEFFRYLEETMADYANKHMEKIFSNQLLQKEITFLILYQAMYLMLKLWTNIWENWLQSRKTTFATAKISYKQTAMEAEKEVPMGSEDESNLEEILSFFDHIILLLGQAMNTCSYFRRFNILMALLGDKKRTEAMLMNNASAFAEAKYVVWTQKWRGCSEAPKLKVKIKGTI